MSDRGEDEDEDDELAASKRRHPAFKHRERDRDRDRDRESETELPTPDEGRQLKWFTGGDGPGTWRRSKINGFMWFEPELFDREPLEIIEVNPEAPATD